MYVPAHFAAEDGDALAARLAKQGAGVLISVGADGAPVATHMPVLWDPTQRVVRGHVARANPHHELGAGPGLIVLSGSQAYVSPNLYPSKAEHGRAVPTWNYEAAHLSGPITWFDDPARLEAVVRDLSDVFEAQRQAPWSLDDAPQEYVQAMLRGVVGVEMRVERIDAVRKLSQNKSEADFAGVVQGLRESGPDGRAVADLMADLKRP